MALLPLPSKDGRGKSVLALQPEWNHFMNALMDLEEDASNVSTVQEVRDLDYSCMRLCGICWESNPSRMKEPIFAFFTGCKHVCCYECMLRWLVLCDQKRCPVCMALEETSKLKDKSEQLNLPYFELPERDYSFRRTDWNYLGAETVNDRVAFTLNFMQTKEAARKFFATLDGDYPFMPFHLIKQNITFGATGEDASIGERVMETLSAVCSHGDKDFTATLFGLKSKKIINVKLILTHLQIHKETLCELCFYHRLTFPREDKVFYPEANLHYHSKRCHMKCKLCPSAATYYYDKDHLVEHCRIQHYMCHVCDSTELFFLTAGFLSEHINTHHFVCNECSSADNQLTAFLTVKELQDHHKEKHSKVYNANRFTTLIRLGKNVDIYEEHPLRDTLDRIDGLYRKLYMADRLKYRIVDGPQVAGEKANLAR